MRKPIRPWSVLGAVVFVSLVLTAGTAWAKQWRYVGGHPVGKGVFCHIDAPHVHAAGPEKPKVLYRKHHDSYYFVGDPVPYGWKGDKHTYRGHHPIQVDVVLGDPGDHVVYCYLDGAHVHAFAPPPEASFVAKGDVYFYVGSMPDEYRAGRVEYGPVNRVYADLHYERPVIEVEPPEGYVELAIGPAVVVEAPAVEVAPAPVGVRAGIGVQVHVPAPVLEVQVGLPGVVVHEHRDVVVVGGGRKHHKHKKHKGRGGVIRVDKRD